MLVSCLSIPSTFKTEETYNVQRRLNFSGPHGVISQKISQKQLDSVPFGTSKEINHTLNTIHLVFTITWPDSQLDVFLMLT